MKLYTFPLFPSDSNEIVTITVGFCKMLHVFFFYLYQLVATIVANTLTRTLRFMIMKIVSAAAHNDCALCADDEHFTLSKRKWKHGSHIMQRLHNILAGFAIAITSAPKS